MPEIRECIAHFIFAKQLYDKYKLQGSDFTLKAIWADYTEDEANTLGLPGHVQLLSPSSKSILRGQSKSQTSVFPQWLKSISGGKLSKSISDLRLADITHTCRSMILHFGPLFFQISYLTHTSVQFYSKIQWQSVLDMTKETRKFRIAVAFEFEDYVLAFPSLDLVFQPKWATSRDQLGDPVKPIYDDFNYFVDNVAKWITKILSSKSIPTAFAIDEVRQSELVWPGVGVYTSSEIFFDAGLSPFLSLYELVTVPSRVARLVAAYFSFAYKSKENLKQLLNRCTVNGLLAPSLDQRLSYSNWLHIYAKAKPGISIRMGQLVDLYHEKLEDIKNTPGVFYRITFYKGDPGIQLYDVFEPKLVNDALTQHPHLADLIYGQHTSPSPTSSLPSALAAVYTSRKSDFRINKNTHLHPDIYKEDTPTTSAGVRRFRNSFAYTFSSKQVWSITSAFPSNLLLSVRPAIVDSTAQILQHIGKEYNTRILSYIIKHTLKVAIGPLEYCGNSGLILDRRGKKIAAVVPFDPRIPEDLRIRVAKGIYRTKSVKSGANGRVRLTEKQKKAQKKILDIAIGGDSDSLPSTIPLQPTSTVISYQPAQKKRRLSQDKVLALQQTDLGEGSRRRRTKN